jgi:hypothetical protein
MRSSRSALFIASLFAVFLIGCGTSGKAIKPDAGGYLATGMNGQAERATVTVNDRLEMREMKVTALVTGSDFLLQQIKLLDYFGEVINLDEMQRRIVQKNLQDKVPSLNDRIGINNAARYYGKFTWIHFAAEKRDGKTIAKLVVTDPSTSKDVFVAEHPLVPQAYVGYDQTTFYPLFNSLIDWLKANK